MESNTRNKILNYIFYFVVVLSLFGVLITCNNGVTRNHWQEEIQLANGQIIWVDRTVELERPNISGCWLPLGDVGIRGTIKNMDATISIPDNPIAPPPPVWRFNAVPLVLDYDKDKKTWFVIAGFFYCNSWEAAGSPALDTWQYVVKDNKWVIEALDKKYLGRITNMYLYFTTSEKLTRVTKDEVKQAIKHLAANDYYKKVGIHEQQCNTVVGFKPGF